jgi:hypothetical protein
MVLDVTLKRGEQAEGQAEIHNQRRKIEWEKPPKAANHAILEIPIYYHATAGQSM